MTLLPATWDPRLTSISAITESTGFVPHPETVAEFNYIYGVKRNALDLPLMLGGTFGGTILWAIFAKWVGISEQVGTYVAYVVVAVGICFAYRHFFGTIRRKRIVVRQLQADYAFWLAEHQRSLPNPPE